MSIKNHYEFFWKDFLRGSGSTYERDELFFKVFRPKEIVLDVACGDGTSTKIIKKITKNRVYGLDISHYAVKKAKKNNIQAVVGDVEKKFPFPSKYFDTVFWGDNIEHVFFPEKTLKEIYRVLKPSGRLILSTPNTGYWRYRLEYFLKGRLPDTEFDNRKRWEWSHIRFFDVPTLKDFLRQNNFSVLSTFGINRRKIDRKLCRIWPNWFGMIVMIEAQK